MQLWYFLLILNSVFLFYFDQVPLIIIQFERQITEMNEKIEKLENEKKSLIGAQCSKDKKSKIEANKAARVRQLEKELADMRKVRMEKERLVKEKIEKQKFIDKMKKDLQELKERKVQVIRKAKQDQKKFDKVRQEKVWKNN